MAVNPGWKSPNSEELVSFAKHFDDKIGIQPREISYELQTIFKTKIKFSN